MKKNILLRTNLLVCAVIILGFLFVSVISYQSNQGIFRRDIESVSALTSEGIYYQIDSIFTKPVNVSLTMANDSLLKDFLSNETQRLDDAAFLSTMRNYLDSYRRKYDYDSVFLVSTATGRYYHFNGLDRTLAPGNPENVWYYDFLESSEECALNIDNDEAAQNEITIFINCKICDAAGETVGVVGVGFRVNYLQELLKSYEDEFGVSACLINGQGTLEISTDQTGYENVNLFDDCEFADRKGEILSGTGDALSFWYPSGYVVSRYIPNLNWHLVIDNNTTALNEQLKLQMVRAVLIILLILAFVLLTITRVIRKYNEQIIQLTVAKEQGHRSIFQEMTEQLYENIYEFDLTHNRASSEATELYFENLGIARSTPYNEALATIAAQQVKEEYRAGYIQTFCPENVLQAFSNGIDNLKYEFMLTNDGQTYYWMRITARIFTWKDDNSVRMLTYRQNIDEEKRREHTMLDQMERDSLTGLYNKAATQEYISRLLAEYPGGAAAFFIFDIDDFKQVNDGLGHAAGDAVLAAFAQAAQAQFHAEDIVGRIGGDEFAAFLPGADRIDAEHKAASLLAALRREITVDAGTCRVTASIGVAVCPESGEDFETLYRNADFALYQTKKHGKDGFTVFRK